MVIAKQREEMPCNLCWHKAANAMNWLTMLSTYEARKQQHKVTIRNQSTPLLSLVCL